MSHAKKGLPRWWIGLAVVAVLGVLLWSLRAVLTPIFFAFLIAYLLDPLVDRLEERRLPRGAAIVVLLAIVLSVGAMTILLVLPTVLRDVAMFSQRVPLRISAWMDQLEPTLAAWGVTVPTSVEQLVSEWHLDLQKVAGQAFRPTAAALKWFLGGTVSMVGALAGLLMVPVFAFYLLYDFDRITTGIGDLVPRENRALVGEMALEVDTVLSQFVRGQLMLMLVLAILYSAGYALVGIPLAVPIGIVAGAVAFIPYVGGAVALVLGLLMCAFDFSPERLGGVLLVYGIVQALEGWVLTPKIVGDKVGLKAVWVLFALMLGGELFGFLGVLLALPVAAVAKIFVVRMVAHYQASELYLGKGIDGPQDGDVLAGTQLAETDEAPGEDDSSAEERDPATEPSGGNEALSEPPVLKASPVAAVEPTAEGDPESDRDASAPEEATSDGPGEPAGGEGDRT